jgi:hypothetical protein
MAVQEKEGMSHMEDVEVSDTLKEPVSNLKLDANGLPLEPQPSDRKDDPLVRKPPSDSIFRAQ